MFPTSGEDEREDVRQLFSKLEMAVRYGTELKAPPRMLPSGWAAFLYLYELR